MTREPDGQPDAGRRPGWLWWLLPLGWMALIWALSAQPDLFVAASSVLKELLAWSAHFLEFAILAFLLWLALDRSTRLPARTALAAAFFGAAAFAALDELHQAFVPGRTPDLRDLLVDLAGILAALALVRRWAARAARRKPG